MGGLFVLIGPRDSADKQTVESLLTVGHAITGWGFLLLFCL